MNQFKRNAFYERQILSAKTENIFFKENSQNDENIKSFIQSTSSSNRQNHKRQSS